MHARHADDGSSKFGAGERQSPLNFDDAAMKLSKLFGVGPQSQGWRRRLTAANQHPDRPSSFRRAEAAAGVLGRAPGRRGPRGARVGDGRLRPRRPRARPTRARRGTGVGPRTGEGGRGRTSEARPGPSARAPPGAAGLLFAAVGGWRAAAVATASSTPTDVARERVGVPVIPFALQRADGLEKARRSLPFVGGLGDVGLTRRGPRPADSAARRRGSRSIVRAALLGCRCSTWWRPVGPRSLGRASDAGRLLSRPFGPLGD